MDKDEFYKELGAALRAAREAKGMTLGALAATIGAGISTVQRYEAGSHAVPAHMLVALHQALEVDVAGLLGTPAPRAPEDVEDPETERLRAKLLQATETVRQLQESTRQGLVMTRCWSDRCMLFPGHRQTINPGCHFDGARWYYAVEPDDAQD